MTADATPVWQGHRDLCSIQWSAYCDCEDAPVSPDDLQAKLMAAYVQGRWTDETVALLVATCATAATLGGDPVAKARAADAMRRAHEAVVAP